MTGAGFYGAFIEYADFDGAYLEGAFLIDADLLGARFLTIDQLSKVKTLCDVKLYKELLIPLKKKYPALFESPL